MIEKELRDLPLEEGKTYKTKMATGWSFTVTQIVKDSKGNVVRVMGTYEGDTSICPIGEDRLIHDRELTGIIFEKCDNCGHLLKTS